MKSLNFEKIFFYAPLIALSLIGVLSLRQYNAAPVSFILETIIFAFLIFSFFDFKLKLKSIFIFLIFFCYFLISLMVTLSLSGAHFFDFLQAYKFVYYVCVLSLTAGKFNFKEKDIENVFLFLIFCILFKYGYSTMLSLTPRMGDRPGLFVENNFELVFVCGIYFLLYERFSLKKKYFFLFSIIFALTLSGSRSAAIGFAGGYLVVALASSNRKNIALKIFPLFFVLLLVYVVFSSRGELDISQIDRFNFLMFFIAELNDNGFLSIVLGNERLTPLSPTTCHALSFYENLFSYNRDMTCYSVIFHSFWLRVLFDHGIIVAAALVYSIYSLLRSAGRKITTTLAIISLISLSGLSVSSFNDYFSNLLLLLAINIKESDNRQGGCRLS